MIRLLALERFQEKWVPVFRPETRPNKDLEHFRESIYAGIALALYFIAGAAGAQAATWTVDTDKSRLGFEATQAGAPFEGRFTRFEAAIDFDPAALAEASARIAVDMTSAATGAADRDGALPGADWFDAAGHPQAVFEANAFRKLGEGEYAADGTLTMRGTALPLTLPFRLRIDGASAHAQGRVEIDRLDYGVGTGQWAGESVAGAAVTVVIDIHATAQAGTP